jgi:colicin import membrane protein
MQEPTSVAEMAVAEMAVAEMAVAEKAVAEMAVAEKAVAEKAVAEKAVAEKTFSQSPLAANDGSPDVTKSKAPTPRGVGLTVLQLVASRRQHRRRAADQLAQVRAGSFPNA